MEEIKKTAPLYVIRRYTGFIDVWPDTEEARHFLTLIWRKMEDAGRGQRKYVPQRTRMYKPSSRDGESRLVSFRGFWKTLKEHLEKKGRLVKLVDNRAPFPAPDLRAAMVPLRDYQRPPQLQFLMAGDSGLKGAPTRWGKSYDMASTILAYIDNPGMKIVVTAPGVDLCAQLQRDLRSVLPKRIEVKGIYSGSKNKSQSEHVTVVCNRSLVHCDIEGTKLVLADETHAWAAEENVKLLTQFTNAMVLGFGATLDGRPDKRDRILTGMFGPVWSNVSYLKAVELDAIAPAHVIMVRVPLSSIDIEKVSDRTSAYNLLLHRSERMAALTRKIIVEAVPESWQTMMFINMEAQAEFYMNKALSKAGVVAMAKTMKPKEREKITREIAAAKHARVLASSIYIQGVTFPDLRVLINLSGGGRNTGTIQRPGRLLQKRDGKNYGVMIDFYFCSDGSCPPFGGWSALQRDSEARLSTYRDIGYDVTVTGDIGEIAEIIKKSHGPGKAREPVDEPGPQQKRRNSKAPRSVAPE